MHAGMQTLGWLVLVCGPAAADELPVIKAVEYQPLAAQVQRLTEALDYVGAPLTPSDQKRLQEALRSDDPDAAVVAIQNILDPYVLVAVEINPESRVKARVGPAKKELMQQGWRTFLVKVYNEAGVTAPLTVSSPNAKPSYRRASNEAEPASEIVAGDVAHRFLDHASFDSQPLNKSLSGLGVEYRIVQLYCRDSGKREAKLAFDVGQGTQDIGFRNEVAILFEAVPATEVTLQVRDETGQPVMGSFVIRDRQGRVYPSPARRLAPDFFFHPQIYRGDGESVLLPPGEYTVEYGRGPEYHVDRRAITVSDSATHQERFDLRRWIEPKKRGWWSGDHHVHAAGCSHYDNPTQGVTPEDMFRHILGEDLNVGCVLSWGPCWYHQKQFFDGKVHSLSRPEYLMRYDVEVSGFPSSHCGHLCLLNLTEDDYPGTTRIEEWPSWDLPVLRWGKEQGGVVGFSHSGWGLEVRSDELPNYLIPPFNGIGANEYIVDVVHGVCDFISAVDTPITWELNIWYHTLNCGFRCRISGETDFPCIYGERVGLGRVYVKLDEPLDFGRWVEGLKQGRSYVTDGLSHLLDFRVNGLAVGDKDSQLDLGEPGTVTVELDAAALLADEPVESIRRKPLAEKPYWHVERARVGNTRKVPVEIVVNGQPVAREEIVADGSVHPLRFEVPIGGSSWIAARIFPTSHTNPVFVHVAGQPIRASRRSAQWCVDSVDRCWEQKSRQIRESEKAEAKAAFDHAKAIYEQIKHEAVKDD